MFVAGVLIRTAWALPMAREHLLCSHPPTVRKVQQLMRAYGNGRDDCAMHHVNASRLDAGAGPAHWCARTHTLYSCSLLGAVLRVELMALCQAPRLPLRG